MNRTVQVAKRLTPLVLALVLPTVARAAGTATPGGFGDSRGERIVTREEILNSGARTLGELLATLPGIQVASDRSRSFPTSGPLVSSDAQTQLSASQFSRVLILFKGHSLNKAWFGGADQDWGTGFLEGLKEIRVYSGPAAAFRASGSGAMDLVVDLIPLDGADQKGAMQSRLSQSGNADRSDRLQMHLLGGDQWGQDGHYAWFGDFTQWAGENVREAGSEFSVGDRMDRKGPTWQAGAVVQKGAFQFTARHLEQEHFDTHYCGRRWGYTFVDAAHTFQLPKAWQVRVVAGGDRIISRWGGADSVTARRTTDWDRVTEYRASLRVEARRESAASSLLATADFRNVWVSGGPDQGDASASPMNFSARRGAAGASLDAVQRLTDAWSLEGTLRIEKASGYRDTGFLPSLSVFYRQEGTDLGVRYAEGQRYMDFWYRTGSGFLNPGYTPYLAGTELEPERNQQVKAWLDQRLGGSWSVRVDASLGQYSHLMGYDWDFALAQGFSQVRATTLGGYKYWAADGTVRYAEGTVSVEASVAYQRVFDPQLTSRQLYVSADGQALYLSPLTTALRVEWKPMPGLVCWGRFSTSGGARNGGVDLSKGTIEPTFNQAPYEDTPSRSSLDLSLRAPDLWRGVELQASLHNALNVHDRTPLVMGGYFYSRGRELTLVARRRF